MALSLRKDDDETDADEIEQRLRNRLADLEGRLDDQQRIRQMREHIQHLRNKQKLELEKAQLEGDRRVEEVKAKARSAVSKAKKQAKRERKRYEALRSSLHELAEALAATGEVRRTLEEAGLSSRLIPRAPNADVDEDPRAFVRELVARQHDVEQSLSRVLETLDGGELGQTTTDVDVLEDRVADLLTNPEVRSQAMTVAEKARMFAEDPGKSQYYREMLLPYAEAIEEVLEHEQRANVVQGARQALDLVEEAFMDSRTYLLRRSGKLDDHTVEAEIVLERIEEAPEDAVDRVNAALDSARALGPVDFFSNLTSELTRRIDRGEDGAGVAAWILSDVTVSILEDEQVRDWLASQR